MSRLGYSPLPTADQSTAMSQHTTSLLDKDPEAFLHLPSHLSHDQRPSRSQRRRRSRYAATLKYLCCLLGILTLSYALIAFFLPERATLALGLFRSKSSQQVGLGELPAFVPELNSSWATDIWEEAAELLEEAEVFEEADAWEQTELLDDAHVLRRVASPLRAPPRLLRQIRRLPHDILMSFYTTGTVPSSLTSLDFPRPHPMDMLYLYVDSTSSIFHAALDERAEQEGLTSMMGKARRWRDNGELRGAIRSASAALGDHLGAVHVVSADLPLTKSGRWRAGQIPRWLNPEGGDDKMKWHFHSDIFRLPRDDNGSLPHGIGGSRWDDEEEWRDRAMPTFNSFAIEERTAWIHGLNEEFVMSNDDMFIMTSLSNADFHHPLLGPSLRLDPSPGLLVKPDIPRHLQSAPGEWGGLQHANVLLSGRFASRSRMYMHHLPKPLRKSLVDEASIMFSHQLADASTRGFRESKRGRADVEMSWLVSHLGIERWREALLWSFVVARVGGVDGVWSEASRTELRRVLGLSEGDNTTEVVVEKSARETLKDVDRIVDQAGWERPKHTDNLWSSFDGHLPRRPDEPSLEASSCIFKIDQCLPPNFFLDPHIPHHADSVLSILAFANPYCGDCLISALINASGPRGLSAFLPGEEQVYYPEDRPKPAWDRTEPILPMTDRWADADFSLASNVRKGQDVWDGIEPRLDGGVRLREWCVKLLSRYAYTYGSTISKFLMIHSGRELTTQLKMIDAKEEITLVCFNDDGPDIPPRNGPTIGATLATWMKQRWGALKAPWERTEFPWEPLAD